MKLETAMPLLKRLGLDLSSGEPVFRPRNDKQIAYSTANKLEISLAGTFTAGELEALVTLMRFYQTKP